MQLPLKSSLLAVTSSAAAIHFFPQVELALFARGAATLASLFTGAPVLQAEQGWLLPLQGQPILVSQACSGTTFFTIVSAILAWHLAQRTKSLPKAASLSLLLSLPIATFINALRIVCLAQAHRWAIPLLPDTYAAFAHMLVGVAVFLPSLIALNIALEYYAHSANRPTATTQAS